MPGYPLSDVIPKIKIMDLSEIENVSNTHSANFVACAVGLEVFEAIELKYLIEKRWRKRLLIKYKINILKVLLGNRIRYILGKGPITPILL